MVSPDSGAMKRSKRKPGRTPTCRPMGLNTLRVVRKRLARQHLSPEAAWNTRMSAFVLAALAAAFVTGVGDEWSIRLVHRSGSPIVDGLESITDIALARWYFYPAALVALVLGLVDWSGRSRPTRLCLTFVFGQALFVAASILLVRSIIRTLKITFGRQRPELMHEDGAYAFELFEFDNLYWSFPSGHAATAGVATIILILWFPRARLLMLPLGALLAISRVAAEEHYPSDVVAGFSIGVLVTIVLARWLASRALIFRHRPGKLIPGARWPRHIRGGPPAGGSRKRRKAAMAAPGT